MEGKRGRYWGMRGDDGSETFLLFLVVFRDSNWEEGGKEH